MRILSFLSSHQGPTIALLPNIFFLFSSQHRTSSHPQPSNPGSSLMAVTPPHLHTNDSQATCLALVPIYKQFSGYFHSSFQMYFSHKPSWFFLYRANFSEELKLANNFALPFKKVLHFHSPTPFYHHHHVPSSFMHS